MKVLFVASMYRHLVSFHIPFMQYFQQQGYEVYAVGNGDEDKEILQALNIQCIDISFSRNPISKDNMKAYKQLQSLFAHHQFSLVHVHTPVPAFLTRLVYRKQTTGQLIYTAHGFHFFKGAPLINWLIYYPIEKIAARWTDYLFVMNEEDNERAKKMMPKEKIGFVHGVGVEFAQQTMDVSALRESLNLRDDAIVISYIAELNKNKNQKYLLRNWLSIKEQFPQAVLLIIGTGILEQQLEAYVHNNGLTDVKFLGYRSDVDQLLRVSDISVLLSYREGLPKSTMESMYMGLPCIVANTRGLRDLIQDGENGLVVPLENDERLVSAFCQLLQSRQLRKTMGERAKQLVQPYILQNVLPEYTTVYEKVLK